MTARKYKKGDQIKTTIEAVSAILSNKFLIVRGKTYHHSWSSSWSLHHLDCLVGGRHVYHAIKVEKS